MSRILYFDAFSGASGDMVLGALLDAGVPIEELRRALGTLTLEGSRLDVDRVLRAGISASKFRVVTEGRRGGHEHGHEHGPAHAHGHTHADAHHHQPEPQAQHEHREPPHADTLDTDLRRVEPPGGGSHVQGGWHEREDHVHRGLFDILALLDASALSSTVRDRAAALFTRLAEAEAAIHDVPIDRIHFHEVGALDSIVDIVGGVFAIEWLAPARVVASPLNVGSGTVRCAHGTMPVPAPATARLLAGVPVYADGPAVELLTPTGALLITGHASEYGSLPPMRVERVGYGAGDRDFPGRPNVLRVVVGDEDAAGTTGEDLVVIECEIDDMNPQIFGVLMDGLHEAGAFDVFYAPVQMKKSRPGTLVTVLSRPADRERLTTLLFRETTTLGVRYHGVRREALAREVVTVRTPLGDVRIKVGRRAGAIVNAQPEFDDCARLAREHGVPVKEAQAMALRAYLEHGTIGRP